MNAEKYEQIKRDYCINVTVINLNARTDKPPLGIKGENLTYTLNNGVVSFIDE